MPHQRQQAASTVNYMRYSLQRSAVNGALDATPPDTESDVLSSIAGSPYQQGLICRASWHLETQKKIKLGSSLAANTPTALCTK